MEISLSCFSGYYIFHQKELQNIEFDLKMVRQIVFPYLPKQEILLDPQSWLEFKCQLCSSTTNNASTKGDNGGSKLSFGLGLS